MANKFTSHKPQAITFLRARTVPHDQAMVEAHLDAQRRRCRQLADELGLEIVDECAAIGGTTGGPGRAAVHAMLGQVAKGGIGYVLTIGLDRLSRRTDEMARIIEALRTTGARLVTCASRGPGGDTNELRGSSIASLASAGRRFV